MAVIRYATRFYERRFEIAVPKSMNDTLHVGEALQSQAGQQLAPICGSAPHPGFQDYAIRVDDPARRAI
jgi:hypothetical protein